MADFEVVEIFESINGEGRFAGELSNFVRLKDVTCAVRIVIQLGPMKQMRRVR